MKSIYILLTKSNTILSKMVYLITADTYTHASISFDKNFNFLYSSSRKNGKTIFPAGPCREYLLRGYYKKNSHIPCAVYELRVSDEVYEKAKHEVKRIICNADKYHFNIIGLVLCRLNIPYHRKYNFFCSQFVSEVLYRSRAISLPKDTSLMRPCDYMKLPELRLLFKGNIKSLTKQRNLLSA